MGRSSGKKAITQRKSLPRKDNSKIAQILEKEHGFIISKSLADANGDWKKKGHINSSGEITPLSNDTKVISKIIEDDVVEVLTEVFEGHGFKTEVPETQNSYPDITVHDGKEKFALDVKTSYRVNDEKINGFTLGAFTGYFRNPESTKNTVYPYDQYREHRVYGVIYDRKDPELKQSYPLSQLEQIPAVIGNFEIINRLKHEIAGEFPGSGNTKNIGAVKDLKTLLAGDGPFIELANRLNLSPEELFTLYWRNYETNNMAKRKPAFSTISEFEKRYQKGQIKFQ